MSCKGLICRFFVALLIVSCNGKMLTAQWQRIPEDEGATGFGLALRKLPTIGSVLSITAHPDDENNALLARLRRGAAEQLGAPGLVDGFAVHVNVGNAAQRVDLSPGIARICFRRFDRRAGGCGLGASRCF